MSVPNYLAGAALAFWGWQTGNLAVGIVLALLVEAARRVKFRFDLGAIEHSRIADLCTVAFVGLAALLAANRGIAHGILESFVWLPVVLAPILAAQFVSESGRIPLSALFRYMRKLKAGNPALTDPPVDVSAVYVAIAVVSAGVANQRGPWFFAFVVLATVWMLYTVRPKRASLVSWVLMLAAGAGIGHAGHVGLEQLQVMIEDWVIDMNFHGVEADPFRTRTEIGTLGRLKQYDSILLRVYAPEKDAERVRYLHLASYNAYSGTAWLARNTPMETIESEADNTTWILAAPAPQWSVRIAMRLERGRGLLALPAGATRLTDFEATAMRRNGLGAVHAATGAEWVRLEAAGVDAIELYAPPTESDTDVPATEAATLARIAAELGLRELPPAEALRRVERYLSGFRYSLYRERPTPAGQTPLGDFLLRTRSGHCEYFGTATALLLRAAGIPARYATGFAVMERSLLEDAFVVRSRHAHAWTRAWIGARWVDVDTTPPEWFAEEESQAPFWQFAADLVRWAGFRWSLREEIKPRDWWYAVLAALVVILAWRVLRGRSLVKPGDSVAGAARRRYPGEDSEFYSVENSLPAREPGEPHAAWLARIGSALPPERERRLREALRLHSRYRFDPQGLAEAERRRLRELCRSLASAT